MTDFSTFLEFAGRANVVPVVETMPADLLTPLAVYLILSDGATNSFLLESVEGGENLARFSFIGADPQSTIQIRDPVAFSELREHFSTYKAAPDHELPPFIGGAIGHMGFSCAEWFEPSLDLHGAPPHDAEFMFFRSVVAFDHVEQIISLISLAFIEGDGRDAGAEALYEEAVGRNRQMRARLETGLIEKRWLAQAPQTKTEVSSNWPRASFERAVERIKELIVSGECYQVVLSQCFTKPTNASPISVYRALRSVNPSPYMFLLQYETKAIVGASPEMLVRCHDDRVEYRPIAGTRPRGRDRQEDDTLAKEMLVDTKEMAEHLMLVDLGRNDLGRVAEFGSIRVDTLMGVEKYSHVQHLVSALSARLDARFDRFDALAACFPAGTVSGAPKVRAIEIIRELEPTERGVYAGAVGYFDYAGNMDMCIAIRTMVLEDGAAKIQAGAGIVADSIPELEFEETVNKAKVLLRALEIAESGLL
jgi:anthranilate synthase component 1